MSTSEGKDPAAVLLGQARWKDIPFRERQRAMLAARQAPGSGRQRSPDRCYCGETSRKRGIMRGFDCCKRAGKFPSGKPQAKKHIKKRVKK